MTDFGEALPFDSKLHGGADPAVWHNRFPEEWGRVNREAIEEAGRGDDIVFFDRSGFTQSPKFATLFWLGDQMQSWDEYDGIKTAVVGMLSGGVSGFSLVHSDVGGYVSLSLSVAGHKIPVIARSDELLQRWMSSPPSPPCSGPTRASIRRSRRSSTPTPPMSLISSGSLGSTKDSPPIANRRSRRRRSAAIRWRAIPSSTTGTIPIPMICAINIFLAAT